MRFQDALVWTAAYVDEVHICWHFCFFMIVGLFGPILYIGADDWEFRQPCDLFNAFKHCTMLFKSHDRKDEYVRDHVIDHLCMGVASLYHAPWMQDALLCVIMWSLWSRGRDPPSPFSDMHTGDYQTRGLVCIMTPYFPSTFIFDQVRTLCMIDLKFYIKQLLSGTRIGCVMLTLYVYD